MNYSYLLFYLAVNAILNWTIVTTTEFKQNATDPNKTINFGNKKFSTKQWEADFDEQKYDSATSQRIDSRKRQADEKNSSWGGILTYLFNI